MKKKVVTFILTLIILFSNNAYALSVSSSSAVIMDTNSGRVLYSKNPDNQRLIASITKIMTCILAIENGNLDDEVTVGEEVLKMYGSNIYIELGEKMKLIDLLYGLMLRSGNDAAVVIATHIGGNETNFVKMMNEKAKEIGMTNTIFNNPHGLDEETQNKSTAYDMALLSSYASHNETYMEIVGTKKYTVQTDKKSYLWNNRNKFLTQYEYATGGKNGYTPSAGKTLVTNSSKDDFDLTVVTLNDGNQYKTHQDLYEYAYNNYKKYLILDKNRFKIDEAYYKDKLYIEQSFSYPLTDNEKDNVKVLVILNKLNNYSNGEEVGEVIVKLYDEEIFSEKVYVSKTRNRKNIFTRIKEWFS